MCERFRCLPSALDDEDVALARMVALVDATRLPPPSPGYAPGGG